MINGPTLAFYAALSLLAGAFIPIMAALSGAMGRSLGNPGVAAVIVVGGAFVMVLAYALMNGAASFPLSALARVTPLQWVSGFAMAFYVTAITFLAPRFGVGNAVMLVVGAQLVSSALIDHFALFGAPHKPVDAQRALGLTLMAIGAAIAQAAANAPPRA